MSKELFETRKNEFIETINKLKRLPKVWECYFLDGSDQRLWFDKAIKLEKYKSRIEEINILLKQYEIKVLTDKEKEEEFLNCVKRLSRVPQKQEEYFSDNSDMYMWYHGYKVRNQFFETSVHSRLREYQELDLAAIWGFIKEEFITIIKELKRLPKHGEVILQSGIDVRVICDKLETYDPIYFERLLLHLQSYNKKALSIDDRIEELVIAVTKLGYIPYLQETRFSDGTDMFTWYIRYKVKLPNLENRLESLVCKEKSNKKVNIYLIPNFKNTGGKFYTILSNVGEKLDLTNINSYEEAKKIDSTIVKRGGVILKKGEEIDSISFKKGI